MSQRKTLYTTSGETVAVSNQWAADAEKRGTTVASSTWTFSGAGTLTGAALTSTLATVKLAATSCGTLTNTATLANGEVLTAFRYVETAAAPSGSVTA